MSPDANDPEERLRLANAKASVPWQPVIEKNLTHLGLQARVAAEPNEHISGPSGATPGALWGKKAFEKPILSMLVLDPASGRYSAQATPSTGTQTLFDHYAALLRGEATDERGEHAVF